MAMVERRTRARAARSGAMLPRRTMLSIGSGRVHLGGRRGGNGRQDNLPRVGQHLAAAAHDLLCGLGVCMGGCRQRPLFFMAWSLLFSRSLALRVGCLCRASLIGAQNKHLYWRGTDVDMDTAACRMISWACDCPGEAALHRRKGGPLCVQYA